MKDKIKVMRIPTSEIYQALSGYLVCLNSRDCDPKVDKGIVCGYTIPKNGAEGYLIVGSENPNEFCVKAFSDTESVHLSKTVIEDHRLSSFRFVAVNKVVM